MHVHLHARCQHTYSGTDGCQYGQRQGWAYCVDGVLHALRHSWQGVVIEQLVLRQRLVYSVGFRLLSVCACYAFLSQGKQHVLESFGHLRALLAQSRVDTGKLLSLGKSVVTRNDAVQQLTVETANVAKVDGKLKGEGVAVAAHRLLRVVVHCPPLADDVGVGDSEVGK